jgi:hypothetical protein
MRTPSTNEPSFTLPTSPNLAVAPPTLIVSALKAPANLRALRAGTVALACPVPESVPVPLPVGCEHHQVSIRAPAQIPKYDRVSRQDVRSRTARNIGPSAVALITWLVPHLKVSRCHRSPRPWSGRHGHGARCRLSGPGARWRTDPPLQGECRGRFLPRPPRGFPAGGGGNGTSLVCVAVRHAALVKPGEVSDASIPNICLGEHVGK